VWGGGGGFVGMCCGLVGGFGVWWCCWGVGAVGGWGLGWWGWGVGGGVVGGNRFDVEGGTNLKTLMAV